LGVFFLSPSRVSPAGTASPAGILPCRAQQFPAPRLGRLLIWESFLSPPRPGCGCLPFYGMESDDQSPPSRRTPADPVPGGRIIFITSSEIVKKHARG
jgi:hypothetical protein